MQENGRKELKSCKLYCLKFVGEVDFIYISSKKVKAETVFVSGKECLTA